MYANPDIQLKRHGSGYETRGLKGAKEGAMARQAAEQTPEEVERKRLLQRACQARYYLRNKEDIGRKKKERYTPEARRREYLRHQAAEVARTRARRARLRAEAAAREQAADEPEGGNQEAKLGTEPPSTSSGGTVPHLTS